MTSPIIGMRFAVLLRVGELVPNLLDLRFRKVSGLSLTVDTESVAEGGQNLYTQQLPKGISHGNLVLERGMVVGSPLNLEFNTALTRFQFSTAHVLVTLLSEQALPLAAWMFFKAWPVRWATSDLDAQQPEVVIDTMELSYARMQPLRL